MADIRLINYFQEGLSQGKDPGILRQNLIDKGFPIYDIQEAYEKVNRNFSGRSNTSTFRLFKKAIIVAFTIILIGFVAFLLISTSKDRVSLTDDVLESGTYFQMNKPNVLIEINNSEGKISVVNIGEKKVSLSINGKNEEFVIGVDRPIDLDNDFEKETVVGVREVNEMKPYLYFGAYRECIEEWECGDWTLCKDSKQSRSCVDINSCPTKDLKPIDSKSCKGLLDLPDLS